MNILEDMMLVYRVTKSYYIDGYSQMEIAKMTGISRPQISRLIKRGQELGIVKIEVHMPEAINTGDLEKELEACLGIQKAIVIVSDKNTETDDFYIPAAKYVTEELETCRNIGIGWGHTLYEIALNLSYQIGKEDTIFYPMIGCSGSINPYLQVSSIIDRFAERYHSKAHYLNLPVYLKDSSISIDDRNKLHAFQKRWEHLDAAVVGIGTFGMADPIYIDEICSNSFLLNRKKDLVGDVLAHMLLKDGSEIKLPDYYHVACSIDILKQIPTVIAVAKGVEKAAAIKRVADEKCISILITDEDTAKEIINR